ncbi:MAG: hypothetical protein ACYDHU_03870 [Acidimicrobiales bacterium]
MTGPTVPPFDDLAVDYSAGQVMEALSILEVRGELPQWALPHIAAVEAVLVAAGGSPLYVGESADAVCKKNGYVLASLMDGLHNLSLDGTLGAGCPIRTVRSFLSEWRKMMRASRPAPKFTPRQH